MPRKPKEPPIPCEFFVWRLFRRDGMYYADGRTNRVNVGKHALGTRDRVEGLLLLRQLDRVKAVEFGVVPIVPAEQVAGPRLPLDLTNGWAMYVESSKKPGVMQGASDKTRKRYRPVGEKFIPFCQQKRIASWNAVTKKVLTDYGRWLHSEGYAERTIYLELTVLKSVNKWLVEEGHLTEAERVKLELSKARGSDTYCYLQEQVCAMLKLCQSTAGLRWMYNVILALVYTGMRIAELSALRWSDVDLVSNTITLPDTRFSAVHQQVGAIRTTKGGRTRRLPIHSKLLVVLKAMPQHPDGRVFHGPRGGALKQDVVRNNLVDRIISPLKKQFPASKGEIGFEHGRLHSFRHFFVSQACLSGASDGVIRDWVGHTNTEMLERYRHLRNADAQCRMERIDFLGEVSQPDVPVHDLAHHHAGGERGEANGR